MKLFGDVHLSFFLLLTFLVCNLYYSESLNCCVGLRQLQTTTDDGLTNDCTNTASSCLYVDCNNNKCQESAKTDNDQPETDCSKGKCNTSSPYAFCRISYFEIRKCEPKCEPGKPNSNGGEWWVRQECFEDPDGDVTKNCDFNHKLVHLDVMTRLTVEKDCYCNTDECNTDIGAACRAVEPNILTNHCELIDDESGAQGFMMKKKGHNTMVLHLMGHAVIIFFIVPFLLKLSVKNSSL